MRTRTKWAGATLAALLGGAVPVGIEASAAAACTPATLSAYGGSQLEGTDATKDSFFLFTVSASTGEGVCAPTGTVHFRTLDGNGQLMPAQYIAVAGSDYVPISDGVLTFTGGTADQHVLVRVRADAEVEDDQAFSLQLVSPTGNLRLGGTKGTFWIRDDDNRPPLEQPAFEVQDGEICWSTPAWAPALRSTVQATNSWRIPIEMSRPVDHDVTLHYRTIQTLPGWQGYVPVQDALITFATGTTRGYAEIQLLPNPNMLTSGFALEIFGPSFGRIAFGRTDVVIKPGA